MTTAEHRLTQWLTSSEGAPSGIHSLAGDVSRRQYFRAAFGADETAVGVTYPPDMRQVCSAFLSTTRLLESVGVRVPRVHRAACSQGLMLVEDLGALPLYDLRNQPWTEIIPFFRQALGFIELIQSLSGDAVDGIGNPPLDADLLRQELEISVAALHRHSDLLPSGEFLARLERSLDDLCTELKSCPLVPCHRDFMARNLMVLADGVSLAVIDHQDLRLGPPFYDLASLLNDSLFPPPELENRLCESLLSTSDDTQLYRRCVVQRAIKASGTFIRFAAAGDDRHLPLIPVTLSRAARSLALLPEGAACADEAVKRWTPTADGT